MQIVKERITPKKAMEWLKRNINNRPLGRNYVEKYAKAMRAGEWLLNGDVIRFNANGDLIDGQHRLTAVVESGVCIECYVLRGLPHEAFDTFDQGNRRTLDHILARRGEMHYTTLAASIRALWRIKVGWLAARGELRPSQMDEILSSHPKIRDSVALVCEHVKRRSFVSPSAAAAFHYAFGLADKDKSALFWNRVLLGEELTSKMPEYVLRERLIENRDNKVAKLPNDMTAAMVVKAWNAAYDNRHIKILKIDSAREEFPIIAGLNYKLL
jgi:hypothetical protein